MTLQNRIRQASERFVTDIGAIVRGSVLEAFHQASKSRFVAGEPPTKAPSSGEAGLLRARPDRSNGLAKHEKRSPMLIEQTTKRLFDQILSVPGRGIEQLADAMGCSTRELALPVRRLLESGSIRTEGEKRATKYYPQAVG